MKNSILTLFFIVSLLFLFGALFPRQILAVVFTRKVFLQNVTSNSTEFRWKTDTDSPVTVRYGTTTAYGQQVGSDNREFVNDHAKITGLSAGTKYYYQLVSGTTALTPAGNTEYYFKTAPPTGSTTAFSWAIWGDSGTGGSSQKNVAKQVHARRPDLVLVAGDVGYPYSSDFNNNNSKHFNAYMDEANTAYSARFTPFYPNCGNHETSCPTLVADHSLPQSGNASGVESTFSWDYGNVHFVSLNTNQNVMFDKNNPQASATQMKWAYNDLMASPQPWKILYFHHNGWSSGSHADLANQINNIYPLAQATGVDAVIWGHSHVYERWTAANHTGPAYFTIGNGGQKNTTSCTSHNPPCLGHSNGEAGFLYVQVNGGQMTFNYITESGTTADTVTYTSGPGVPTVPPPISSPTPFRSPTPVAVTNPINPTRTPTPVAGCTRKNQGDADCNGIIDLIDYEIWRREFTGTATTRNADYNADGFVNLIDFEIWRRPFTGTTSGAPTPTPTLPSPQIGDLDISICHWTRGPFSANVTNPWFPLPVGLQHIIESSSYKVQFTVLNQTELVAGVTTRVVEEKEWNMPGNVLREISRNFFVQAPDGTVCYYGEDVDIYTNGVITGHSGAWRAGVGSNLPGIQMPANPVVGQKYQQEVAPGVAMDRAEHIAFEPSLTTPAGTFTNVLFVQEDPPSTKRYARNVGMVFDDGMLITRL